MQLCAQLRQLAFRLPASRHISTPSLSPSVRARQTKVELHVVTSRSLSTSAMFKKAVQVHDAMLVDKAAPSFASSPPTFDTQLAAQSNSISLPLKATSANTIRPVGAYQNKPFNAPRANGSQVSSNQHAGVKRSANGLTKSFSGQDGFENSLYPRLDCGAAKKARATEVIDLEEFQEDFPDDVDLSEEDLSTKAQVSYPNLNRAMPRPFIQPTLPRMAAVSTERGLREFTADSGYVSGMPTKGMPLKSSQPGSSAPLPWSQSPVRPVVKPDLQQYALGATKRAEPGAPLDKKKPARKLFWQDASAQEETKLAATPVTKTGNRMPWNITASAIKEGQKKARETNKSRTNDVSKDNQAQDVFATTKKKSTRAPKVLLSNEQQHVLELVTEKGKSTFFTGSAGTGKSVLLREIIAGMRRKYSKELDRVATTASTGLAACNVGGVTLHSFAGIGLGKEPVPDLVKKIKRNQKAKHRWMRTKVLIIDEVSMVDAELFDKLEEIARLMRNNGRPFGGIQLVITGDFFQLPPVPDGGKREAKFCFDAHTWNTTIEHTIGLHHVFRQKDPVFAGMLNEMREGRLSPDSIAKFRSLSRALSFDDDLEATELFPTRAEVERANQTRLANLQGETRTYEARDGGTIIDKVQRDKLLGNCMAPAAIPIKKGAQVMLIKNIDETLVNGSLGKVIGFMSEVQFDNYMQNEEDFHPFKGKKDASDEETDTKKSRSTHAEQILGVSLQTFPVVRFAIADGTTRDLLCQRETWKVELPNGEVQASRSQVPLILAWALSIHKAQGQTLERVKVDLGKVFEKGQAYVALSRATSMAGLQISRFDATKVMAHDRVRNFYAQLSRAEKAGGMVKAGADRVGAGSYEDQFLDGEEFDGSEI